MKVQRTSQMVLIASKCYNLLEGANTMGAVQISARIDEALKNAIEKYCKSRGIVMNHFIQEALLDRLEELEDIEDLKKIRHEPTRPFSEVLAELKLDGKI
jgi:hypothetical protein